LLRNDAVRRIEATVRSVSVAVPIPVSVAIAVSVPAAIAVPVLKAHWRSLVAADFLTVEVWRIRGLMRNYVLFFIELPRRTVRRA
jgi:hypothetical protein